MKLRIISGFLKGRYITVADTNQFRPTLERTRESVAEIIKLLIPGARVADVCAGSGAMGLELLSRGAVSVDFIEKDRKTAEQLRKNVKHFGVEERCNILVTDVLSFLKNQMATYDIIFYDPPYDNLELKRVVLSMIEKLSNDGIFLYEQRKTRNDKNTPKPLPDATPYDSRTFGETLVEFYQRQKI
jgi:16S rRNA (guanine966-N2)-methyltransferase